MERTDVAIDPAALQAPKRTISLTDLPIEVEEPAPAAPQPIPAERTDSFPSASPATGSAVELDIEDGAFAATADDRAAQAADAFTTEAETGLVERPQWAVAEA